MGEAQPALVNKQGVEQNARTLGFQEMDVPEWGGAARIRELSGVDRGLLSDAWDRWRKLHNGSDQDWNGYEAFVVAWTMVDANNKRIYTDAEVMGLNQASGRVLDRVARFAMKINALGPYMEQALPKS